MISDTELFFRDETPRPLGRLTWAGALKGGRGTGRMRIFGQRAIVLLVAGAGHYSDARGLRREVTAGAAILVFPALAHRYGPDAGQNWDEIYLCFDGPLFDLWENQGLLDASQPIARVADASALFERLRALCQRPRPLDDAENLRQLAVLQEILVETFPAQPVRAEAAWISHAKMLLQADLSAPLRMPEVARRVGMSYASFRKEFARQNGVSPLQYRAAQRLNAAQTLLLRGEMTSAAIACSLGYGDEAHFSKTFKAATNASPRAWARQQRAEASA